MIAALGTIEPIGATRVGGGAIETRESAPLSALVAVVLLLLNDCGDGATDVPGGRGV